MGRCVAIGSRRPSQGRVKPQAASSRDRGQSCGASACQPRRACHQAAGPFPVRSACARRADGSRRRRVLQRWRGGLCGLSGPHGHGARQRRR